MKKINLYHMEILEQGKTETHYIMRVPGGWIFTDRRGDTAVGTFIPWHDMGYSEDAHGNREYDKIEIDKI